MKNKTCCVIGIKKIPNEWNVYVETKLRKKIIQSINEGYTHFISGFEEGTDLIFAKIVVELRKQRNVTLEAAIPYYNRINSKNETFKELSQECDFLSIHSGRYDPGSFCRRNKYIVNNSLKVIVVDSGLEREVCFTMDYAIEHDKRINYVPVEI